MNTNSTLSLINSIQKVSPTCEVFNELDEWHNQLNQQVLSVLHINIRSMNLHWELLLIKIVNLLPKLDLLILTEINLKEEEALAFQLRNFSQINKCRTRRRGGGVIKIVFQLKISSTA